MILSSSQADSSSAWAWGRWKPCACDHRGAEQSQLLTGVSACELGGSIVLRQPLGPSSTEHRQSSFAAAQHYVGTLQGLLKLHSGVTWPRLYWKHTEIVGIGSQIPAQAFMLDAFIG